MQAISDPSAIDPECDSVLDQNDEDANAGRTIDNPALYCLDDDVTQASSKFYRSKPTEPLLLTAKAKKIQIFGSNEGFEVSPDEKLPKAK